MTYLKFVYLDTTFRKPCIAEYKTKKEANLMKSATMKWGIGVASCTVIEEKEAKRLLKTGEAEKG